MLFELDGNILLWIQEYIRNPELTEFFRTITHWGDHGEIWILTGVLLLFFAKSRKAGLTVLMALLLSLLFNNMFLKNVIARVRPYEVIEGLLPLIPGPRDFSFPSGHTASSFAAAVSIYRNMPKKFGICALILAGLIALSRLYLGVHYPTDVLGGIAFGCFAAYSAGYLFRDRAK